MSPGGAPPPHSIRLPSKQCTQTHSCLLGGAGGPRPLAQQASFEPKGEVRPSPTQPGSGLPREGEEGDPKIPTQRGPVVPPPGPTHSTDLKNKPVHGPSPTPCHHGEVGVKTRDTHTQGESFPLSVWRQALNLSTGHPFPRLGGLWRCKASWLTAAQGPKWSAQGPYTHKLKTKKKQKKEGRKKKTRKRKKKKRN